MHNTKLPTLRRSSRVPVALPILVTSLEPGARFSEVCETMVVNAHGCAMKSPIKLEAGVPLHFHHQDGRETTAQVVYCRPIGGEHQTWMLGASFDHPENFWGLKASPKDWMKLVPSNGGAIHSATVPGNGQVIMPDQTAASVKMALERMKKQLSDEHLKIVLAELIGPIEAEVSEIKERLSQGARRNRFEVSLSQIPPELEQQLEARLKKELGPVVLQQAKDESEKILETAKSTITQKTKETHDQFLHRVTRDLEAVEVRTKGLSADNEKNLREHLHRGLGELHQEVIDAGNRLKRLSDDLLRVMEHNLGEEHDARRRQLEQVQAAVAQDSSRLQEQIAKLDQRMSKLDESARLLESGLDQRLSKLSSDTVRATRTEMEQAVDQALNDLAARGTQVLGSQIDEATGNLHAIQQRVASSISDSLKVQVGEALQSFESTMDELAAKCVERWRVAFAGGLTSLARILGEQFVLQAGPEPAPVEADSRNGRSKRLQP